MRQYSTTGSSSQLPSYSRRCSWRRDGRHLCLVASCLVFCLSLCLLLPCAGYGSFRMSDQGTISCSLKDSTGGVDGKLHPGEGNDQEGVVSRNAAHVHGVRMRAACGRAFELGENSDEIETGILNGSSSPHVEVRPPVLDWGTNTLYTPSLVVMNVANAAHRDTVLHVYDLFSTNRQFYPYDFDEISLLPGDSASISIVFLPRWLGLSSAHIVMQTNFGGFVIHAKGVAIDSPYRIERSVGLGMASDGSLNRTFSLYNPSDNVIYIDEVAAWISISSRNINHSAHVICSKDASHQSYYEYSSFVTDEWLTIKDGELGLSWVEIRPHKQWEVPPHNAEAIVEMSFWPHLEGEAFGAICIQLRSSIVDRTDTVIVPIEEEVHDRKTYHDLTGLLSVFLEPLLPCEGRGPIFSLSARNDASYLLNVEEIREVTKDSKLFQVNYMERLILYPKTVTQIAMIGYTLSVDPRSTEIPSLSSNCELFIVTNDSASKIKVPCQDLLVTCSRYQHGSSSTAREGSNVGLMLQQEKKRSMNTKTGSFGSIVEEGMPIKTKLIEVVKADELILQNWRSQGTMSEMTVLEDRDVLFPVVLMGTHSSRWTTERNISPSPFTMQLLLNSIDDRGKPEGELSKYSFVSMFGHIDSTVEKDGFSIIDLARTEAVGHPLGSTLVGPVGFCHSQQCMWRRLALIRKNFSCIEWLRAFGGSHSLFLLEGSDPVRKLEFHLDLPISVNICSWDLFSHMATTSASCGNLLSKEVYSKNTGKFPLQVPTLHIAEIKCGSGGSMIHGYEGFAQAPGESIELSISSQADCSAPMVHRGLELATAHDIFVIPMKATLPVYGLGLYMKLFFGSVLWNLSVLVLTVVSVAFLVFVRIIPHAFSSGTVYYLDKNTIATISRAGKPSRPHRNTRKLNSRSVGEDGKCETGYVATTDSNCRDHQDKATSSPPSSVNKPVVLLDKADIVETPYSADLTVRIVRERGRRRKKRAATGATLSSKFEVSSSQSGNSTPSSPLSPDPLAPKQMWHPSLHTADNTFSQVLKHNHQRGSDVEVTTEARTPEAEKHEARAPEAEKHDGNTWPLAAQEHATLKSTRSPTLLPCATFPGPGWHAAGVSAPNLLASISTIAPHARAPGSRLIKDKTIEGDESNVLVKEFTYDIWGNHFPDHFFGRPKEITSKVFDASEGDSQSFFAREPQDLMTMSSARSVTPGHKLPSYDVKRLYQME